MLLTVPCFTYSVCRPVVDIEYTKTRQSDIVSLSLSYNLISYIIYIICNDDINVLSRLVEDMFIRYAFLYYY